MVDHATGRSQALGYDGQARLIAVDGERQRGYQDGVYHYDLTGNRVGETCGGQSLSYGYGVDETTLEPSNRLVSVSWEADDAPVCGGTRVTVTRDIARDQRGRALQAYTRKFPRPGDGVDLAYGPSGRLRTATVAETGEAYRYAYDHRALRVAKAALGSGARARFSYGQDGQLLSETTPDGQVREYGPIPRNGGHGYSL